MLIKLGKPNMENLVFTQLSVPEIRLLFRSEIEDYFTTHKPFGSPQPEWEKHISIQQASTVLNICIQTIYGLVNKKRIPYSKVGKRLYFLESDLLAWIKSGRRQTQSEIDTDAKLHLSNLGKGAKNG